MATPLPVLASTYALWHFDEAAGTGIADAGPHSINLAKNAISGSNEAIVPSFLTRARRFAGLGVYDPAGIAGPGSAGDLAMWQGEWTVEALFTPNGAPAPDPGYGGLLAYATAFTTPATNNGQALILVKRSGGINSISVGWYNGIGNLIITDSTLTVADGVRAFIAVVKRIVAGNATLDFYKDGTLAQSIAGIAQPTGGLNAGWLIGCTGDSSQPNLFGDLDELRVSNVAFTAAQILADHILILSSPAVTSTLVLAGNLGGGGGGGGGPGGQQPIAVGDIIQQAQGTNFLQQRVVAVSYDSGLNQTTVTLDAPPAYPWSNTQNLTVLKAIPAKMRFLPIHADQPLTAKDWGDGYASFRYFDLDFISVGWASDMYTDTNMATENSPVPAGVWAPDPVLGWGKAVWGRQTRDVLLKLTMPSDFSYSAQLTPTLIMQNALARFELSALDIKIAGETDRAVR